MFRGNHPAKIEESGRLKVPVPFKQLLDAANITDLYVTTADGERAQIWPLDEWKKNESRLKKHSVGNKAVKNYLDMTGYHGQEVRWTPRDGLCWGRFCARGRSLRANWR